LFHDLREAGVRLWTIHPSYLDARGLVAAWREGLLAQKALGGATRGYARHPQLERFKASPDPAASIARYLRALLAEAEARGYSFDASRIAGGAAGGGAVAGGGTAEGGARTAVGAPPPMPVNAGQVRYELELLRWKLERRSPADLRRLPDKLAGGGAGGPAILLNPAFSSRPGPIEGWERALEEVRARLGGA
jgi:hypothetical protein